MTVQIQNPTQYYAGPISIGTELSVTDFTFAENSHVSVKVRGASVNWVYGSDYAVSGAGTLDRRVTVLKKVEADEILAVFLDVPITQGVSPEEGGNLPAATLEYTFDKLTYICQDLNQRLRRALQVSVDSNFDGIIYDAPSNTGKAFIVNELGTGISYSSYSVSDLEYIAKRLYTSINNVDIVADNMPSVLIDAQNITAINTSAQSITSINTTATNILDVNTVANNIGDINIVGDNIANVNTVANDTTNIDIVSANISNINAVSSNISDVNIVADSAENMATIVSNMPDIAGAADMLKAKVFHTVALMKSDVGLRENDAAFTEGYYSSNDGGSGFYRIRTKNVSDIEDGGSIIFVSNSLVAELIVINDIINVKQFSAVGDGTTDDTTAFNNCISFAEANNIHSIIISEGTYVVSLDFSGDTYNLKFYGNNSDLISANNEYIVKSDNTNYSYAESGKTFYRCRFLGKQTTQYGVYIYATNGMDFEQCTFNGFTVAGAYLMFGEYCNFTLCNFSACISTNAYGALLDCIGVNARTNEVAFTRCQFFSNYNALGIFGCELTRVFNCTIQGNTNYGIYISGINNGGNLGYGTYIYGCWFEFNNGNYSIYDYQSTSTTIECCCFGTIGDQQIYMRNPIHNRIANNTSLSYEQNTIDLVTTTAAGTSIYLINNILSVTRNYVQVPQEFIIDTQNNGEGFQTRFLPANKITTANNTNLNLNTHVTAGSRSCYLNFSQGDTVASYIQQDFNTGKIVHKTGFGTIGSIIFNMNGSDKYMFKYDRCILPLQVRADNTAAQDLGTGVLYRDNSGVVRVVY